MAVLATKCAFASLHKGGSLLSWNQHFWGGELPATYEKLSGAREIQSTNSFFVASAFRPVGPSRCDLSFICIPQSTRALDQGESNHGKLSVPIVHLQSYSRTKRCKHGATQKLGVIQQEYNMSCGGPLDTS